MNGLKITFNNVNDTLTLKWFQQTLFTCETMNIEKIKKSFYDKNTNYNNINCSSIQYIVFDDKEFKEHNNEKTIELIILKILSFNKSITKNMLKTIINNIIQQYYSINPQIQPNNKK
jgi:hypothetical protein